jgi:hypothetical protein
MTQKKKSLRPPVIQQRNDSSESPQDKLHQIRVIGYWITEDGVKASFHMPAPSGEESFADINVDFAQGDLPPPKQHPDGKLYYQYAQLISAFVRLMRTRLLPRDNKAA